MRTGKLTSHLSVPQTARRLDEVALDKVNAEVSKRIETALILDLLRNHFKADSTRQSQPTPKRCKVSRVCCMIPQSDELPIRTATETVSDVMTFRV